MTRPVRYCVLTTQRSGSTWFMSSLNAMPGIAGYMELFLPHSPARDPSWLVDPHPPGFYDWVRAGNTRLPRPIATRAYLNWMLGFTAAASAVGFKLMINQGLRYYPEVLPLLRAQGYRIIVLTRDPLELAISRYVAQQTRISHLARPTALAPVAIDPAWFRHDVRRRLLEYRLARGVLRALGFRAHWLDYKDLQTDTPGTLGDCAAFLDCPDAAAGQSSPMVKVLDKPYAELITNYDALQAIAREIYGRQAEEARAD